MDQKTVEELKSFLKSNKVSGYSKLNKDGLVKLAKKVQGGRPNQGNNTKNVSKLIRESYERVSSKNKEYQKLKNEYDAIVVPNNFPRRTWAAPSSLDPNDLNNYHKRLLESQKERMKKEIAEAKKNKNK